MKQSLYISVIDKNNILKTKTWRIPGADHASEELVGNGANQRMFRKFMESS